MRIGFTVKELGKILGIGPNHIKQAIDPAMEKLAMLWRKNPTKTMDLLLSEVKKLDQRYGPVMTDVELEDRIKMATGRFDHSGKLPEKETTVKWEAKARAQRV